MINFYARLLDGNTAYHHLLALLRQSTHPNLFDDHPPFQIDGNFGGCAGLAEMILQSQANEIHLLPALPDVWPQGAISGLRARGGFEVDIAWQDGKMAQAMVKSGLGRSCQVRSTTQVQVSAGGQLVEVETVDGNTVRFQTQTDGQYRLDA
jgi:alpha-L-fucosidase 2